MAVPGLTPELPLRAKVRCGDTVEKQGRNGTFRMPRSFPWFVCDDSEFAPLVGDKPNPLRIEMAYATADECFPSGLEKWAKKAGGKGLLICYTKGDGVAHGLGGHLDENGDTQFVVKEPRCAFECKAQACRFYGPDPATQGCRPMARLSFFLPGGPRDGVYKFETKGIDTIKGITAVLQQYDGDLRGKQFDLSVEIVKRGANQFPVVSLKAAPAPSTTIPVEATVPPLAAGSGDGGADADGRSEFDWRAECRRLLDQLGQDETDPVVREWVHALGYERAGRKLEARVVEQMEREDRGE